MGYPERAFLMMRETPLPDQPARPATEPVKESSMWENDHVHAGMTAAGLAGLAIVAWLAGLRVAPIGCVIFAVLVFGTDIGSRFGRSRQLGDQQAARR